LAEIEVASFCESQLLVGVLALSAAVDKKALGTISSKLKLLDRLHRGSWMKSKRKDGGDGRCVAAKSRFLSTCFVCFFFFVFVAFMIYILL